MFQPALIPLAIASLLTLGFVPMTMALAHASGPNAAGAGAGILFLSLLRGGFLVAGLVAATGTESGGSALSAPAGSRSAQITALVIGAVVIELTSCGLHRVALDSRT